MAHEAQRLRPEDALAEIAALRGYRERLTAQAAGVVWMVWGLVIALAGLVALFTTAQFVDGEKEVALLLWGLAICGGALVTNAVLRMQALETASGPAAWAPYALGAGALAAVVLLDGGLAWAATHLFGLPRGHGLGFASFNLLPAAGAATIAFLQRRRLGPGLGYAAAAAFLALGLAGMFAPWNPGAAAAFFWSCAWLALALVAYFALGLRAWVRG